MGNLAFFFLEIDGVYCELHVYNNVNDDWITDILQFLEDLVLFIRPSRFHIMFVEKRRMSLTQSLGFRLGFRVC